MKRYVKKPVEIEAVQLATDNISEVLEWANSIQPADKQIKVYDFKNSVDEYKGLALLIPTKEGEMQCNIGDYLIKEPFPTDDRMFYPCKPDMFALTYDEVK